MPKTKDAFALRDFDTTRIFETLNFDFTHQMIVFELFPSYTHDEVFLDVLSSRGNSGWAYYGEIISELKSRRERILRHINRLARYSARVVLYADSDLLNAQNKIRRFKKLSDSYKEIADAFQKLYRRVEIGAREVNLRIRHEFASRLRKARQSVGLTQAQLAKKIDMSQSGYTQYELARRDPSIPTLIRLAAILGCNIDWLLGLTP